MSISHELQIRSDSNQTTQKKIYDFVIVGAGIMGLLTAYELASSGARILLIERQQVGKESSWAGGGILSPLYPWRAAEALQPLFLWSLKNYPALIQTLHQSTGIDPEWLPSGLLALDSSDANEARTWAQKNQLSIETLNHQQLHENHAYLNKTFTQGLSLPFVAQVRNPRLLQALVTALSDNASVHLLENQPVIKIQTHNSRIIQLITPDHSIQADQIIFCSGAWSQDLLKPLDIALPIEPVLGQMLLLESEHTLFSRILLHQDHYLIPRRGNLILVGSTLEKNQFNKTITDTARQLLLNKATDICPALGEAQCIQQWAGLRPYAPNGIPWIGKIPQMENAWINAGHFRNGLTLAPASCRLLVDLLLKRTPMIDPKSYDPTAHYQV